MTANGLPSPMKISVLNCLSAGTPCGCASRAAIVTTPGVGNSSGAPPGAASAWPSGTRELRAFSLLAA